jgi:hypothetical protein
VGEDAATQVLGELALDVARQAAAVGRVKLSEHGLGVTCHQLVQHRAFRLASLIAAPQRLSGGAGGLFIHATCERARAT